MRALVTFRELALAEFALLAAAGAALWLLSARRRAAAPNRIWGYVWRAALLLVLADALYVTAQLARGNVYDGWDECVYIISAKAFRGLAPAGLFRFDRPPLTALLAALAYPYTWIVSWLLIWGAAFCLWGAVRRAGAPAGWLAVILLLSNGNLAPALVDVTSEAPALFLMAGCLWACAARKPAPAGLAAGFALLARWNLFPLIPLTAAFFWCHDGWKKGLASLGGVALPVLPWAIWMAARFGSPLAPLTANLAINTAPDAANTGGAFYLLFPQVWTLSAVAIALAGYVHALVCKREVPWAAHWAMLATVLGTASLLFISKEQLRFLAPFIPCLYFVALFFILRLSHPQIALAPFLLVMILNEGHLQTEIGETFQRNANFARTEIGTLIRSAPPGKKVDLYQNQLSDLEVLQLQANLDMAIRPISELTGRGLVLSRAPLPGACQVQKYGTLLLLDSPCGGIHP